MFNKSQYKLQILLITTLTFIFIFLCSGCSFIKRNSEQVSIPHTSQPLIYTSIYPLYDFTKKIGGEKINLINITPAGAEPHSFEPSTKLLAELSKASLFLYHGAGLEPYLENLLETLQESRLLMIEANQGIELIIKNEQIDPHSWLSPSCAKIIGQNILQALMQIDPENKDYYQNNYQRFEKNLTTLDQEYRNTLALCQKKRIIVTHEAFNYLCQEYNLEQVPIMGLNAEAEPTPGKLKEISQLIKQEKINYIFSEALYSPKIAATIADETGATILQLHPIGSLSVKELQAGKDYFSIMRENLTNLQLALE